MQGWGYSNGLGASGPLIVWSVCYCTCSFSYYLDYCSLSSLLSSPTRGPADNICPGHNEFDVMEFGNFLGKGETYTNRGFYDFIHPWNDQLPYTYDAFDFEYCSSYNYTF